MKLLIDELPLIVLPSLVSLVGIERAIILQQVHYACQQPRSGEILEDREKWIYNTYEDWKKYYFPFWSVKTIQRHFLFLESWTIVVGKATINFKLILSCQPDGQDRKKYYRVNRDEIERLLEIRTSNALDVPMSNKLDVALKESKKSNKDFAKITANTIISLYQSYNPGNAWKKADDKIAAKFNDADVRLIEIAIITTQFNCEFKKINSFGYYKPEIEKIIEQRPSEQMIDFMIGNYRDKWRKAKGIKPKRTKKDGKYQQSA